MVDFNKHSKYENFRIELTKTINRTSTESLFDLPDYVISAFIISSLRGLDKALEESRRSRSVQGLIISKTDQDKLKLCLESMNLKIKTNSPHSVHSENLLYEADRILNPAPDKDVVGKAPAITRNP